MCAGSADFLAIWITIARILIIELDPSSWAIPKTLSPFGQGHAKSHGLIFDLVGKDIFSPNMSHFTAVFRKGKAVFEYDGMHNGGHSMQIKGAKLDTHLGGVHEMNTDKTYPCAVIYTLRGGERAQVHFHEVQKSKLAHIHQIQVEIKEGGKLPHILMNKPGFEFFEDSQRFWMHNPYNGQLAD
jgi:hypothetical protein